MLLDAWLWPEGEHVTIEKRQGGRGDRHQAGQADALAEQARRAKARPANRFRNLHGQLAAAERHFEAQAGYKSKPFGNNFIVGAITLL
jgi:hypothetical protein